MKRAVRRAARVGGIFAIISIFSLMLLITSDVIGRYWLNHPVSGAEDIAGLLMILLVFLAIPITQVVKGHVSVELVTSRFSSRNRAVLNCFTSFVSAVVFGLMAWRLGVRAWISFLNPAQNPTPLLKMPIGPFVLGAAIGIFLLFLVLLVDFSDSLAEVRKPSQG